MGKAVDQKGTDRIDIPVKRGGMAVSLQDAGSHVAIGECVPSTLWGAELSRGLCSMCSVWTREPRAEVIDVGMGRQDCFAELCPLHKTFFSPPFRIAGCMLS